MEAAAENGFKSIPRLSKNIYNFSIRYVNNSLANASNMHLYVYIVTRIKHLFTWLLGVKHR